MNDRLSYLVASGQASERDLDACGVDQVHAIKSSLEQPQIRAKELDALEVSDEERTIKYVVSDETPDRVGDIVNVKGWELDRFKQNPVILWAHDGDRVPPIGRAKSVERTTKPDGSPALVATIEYAPKEVHAFADTIYQLAKNGYLKATSVGFLPKATKKLSQDERRKLGMGKFGVYYDSAELLEVSVVSVPANPSALQDGTKSLVSKGLIGQKDADAFLEAYPTPLTEMEYRSRISELCRSFADISSVSEVRAAADALKVGDMVRWNSSGGSAEGEIERIERDGTIDVPDSEFMIEGTEEDPAALIRVFRDDEPTDTLVGHKFSTLTKIAGYSTDDEDEDKMGHHDDEDEDKMGRHDEEDEDKKSLPDGVLPKHIHSVEETEDTYIITFGKAETMRGSDEEDEMDKSSGISPRKKDLGRAVEMIRDALDILQDRLEDDEEYDDEMDDEEEAMADEAIEVEEDEDEEVFMSRAFQNVVQQQADHTQAMTMLVDCVGDLTKTIHGMAEGKGGASSRCDSHAPDALPEPTQETLDSAAIQAVFDEQLAPPAWLTNNGSTEQ